MMFTCPVCGKMKIAYWPEFWVWRRGEDYLCSENCQIVYDTQKQRKMSGWIDDYFNKKKGKDGKPTMGKGKRKVTLEQKKKAVQIAIDGGDPREYLRQCGSENPDSLWWYVKKVIKEKDPALYEKIPEKLPYRKPLEEENTIKASTVTDAINGMQEATDKFFDSCKDMGLLQHDQTVVTHAVITAEPINEPIDPEDVKFQIVTVRGELGEYRVDGEEFLYTGACGNIKMASEDLTAFLAECSRAAKLMEVS